MISVTILTKNSEKYLCEVLGALLDFDEVVVLDSGSTDRTLEIAAQFANVSIHRDTFTGFGEMHNKATALARNDWILSIDSDEVPTPELIRQIQGIQLNTRAVYCFPRKNYFNGRFIRHCGWYPDRIKRLYHRKVTAFSDAQVHESVITEGLEQVQLTGAVTHYSYGGISDFLAKMQSYSELYARQHCGKKASSPCKAALHGIYAFIKTYLIQRGFLDGWEGFIIATYNGNTAFYKYLKLHEANSRLSP